MKEYELALNYIEECLNNLSQSVLFRNCVGKYDINLASEVFYCKILNMIYGWELESFNNNNEDSIDLYDYKNRVCVQITSNIRKNKITNTMDKFLTPGNKKNQQFDRMIFIMIKGKTPNQSEYKTNGKFDFSIKRDVWDFKDIYKYISLKLDIDVQIAIANLLKIVFKNDISEYEMKNITKRDLQLNLDFPFYERKVAEITNLGVYDFRKEENIYDALAEKNKIVLIGEGCNGKSIVAKNIINTINQNNDFIFPFYFELNNYTNEEIQDLIPYDYKRLPYKRMVFVFDGLDEIRSEHISTFICKLEKFIEQNDYDKSLRFLITVRPNFYRKKKDNYPGDIKDFAEYELIELSNQEINDITTANGINFEDFFEEAQKKELLNLIKLPFNFNYAMLLFKDEKQLPKENNFIDTIIDRDIDKALSKYKNKNLTFNKKDIINVLMKIAFFIQSKNLIYLKQNEFKNIYLSSDEKEIIKHSGICELNASGEFRFSQNVFREKLTANFMIKFLFSDVISISTYKYATNKIKDNWIRTIEFLIPIYSTDELIKWVIKNQPEIIHKSDVSVLTTEEKNKTFKEMFEFHAKKYKWNEYGLYYNKKFIDTYVNEEIVNYLIEKIKSTDSEIERNNALQFITYTESIYDFREKLKEILVKMCESRDYDNYYKRCCLVCLADHKIGDALVLNQIIKAQDKEDAYLRSGYFYYCCELSIVDENIELYIDKLSEVDDGRYASSLNSDKITYMNESIDFENSFLKIQNIETVEKLLSYFEKQKINYPKFEEKVHKNICTSIVNIAKNCEIKKIEDALFRLYMINEHNYDVNNLKVIVETADALNIRIEVFKKYLKLDSKKRSITYEVLSNCETTNYFITKYQKGEYTDEQALEILRFTNYDVEGYEKLYELYNERNKIKFELPKPRKQKENTVQEYFSLIFNKEEFKLCLKKLFDIVGKEEINAREFWDIEWTVFNDNPLLDDIRSSIHFYTENDTKITKDIIDDWDWDYFILSQSYDILSNKDENSDVKISDKEFSKLKSICEEMLNKTDFRNAITYNEDGGWQTNYLCILLWFFAVKFEFNYPDSTYLDMLQFEHYLNNEPVGIDYIERRLSYSKIKSRILENLKSNNLHREVLKNHIDFCIRNKIADCYDDVEKLLYNKSIKDEEREAIVDYLVSTNIKKFIDVNLSKLNDRTFIYAIKKIIDLNKYIGRKIKFLMMIRMLKCRDIHIRMTIAKFLVTLDSKIALLYYYFWIKKNKKSYTNNFSYDSINASISKIDSIRSLKVLFRMLNETMRTGFEDDKFDRFYSNIISAIKNIGVKDYNNYKRVTNDMKKFMNRNHRLNGIEYLNYTLIDLERTFLNNNNTPINDKSINAIFDKYLKEESN